MDQLSESLLEETLGYIPGEAKILNLTCKSWRSITVKNKLKYHPNLKLLELHGNRFSLVRNLDIWWSGDFENLIFPNLKAIKLSVKKDSDIVKVIAFLSNHLRLETLLVFVGSLMFTYFESLLKHFVKVLPKMKRLSKFHYPYAGESFSELINSLPKLSLKNLKLSTDKEASIALEAISSKFTNLESLNMFFLSISSDNLSAAFDHPFLKLKIFDLCFSNYIPRSLLPKLLSKNFPLLTNFSVPELHHKAYYLNPESPNQWSNLFLTCVDPDPDHLHILKQLDSKKNMTFYYENLGAIESIVNSIISLTHITRLHLKAINCSEHISSSTLKLGFEHLPHLSELSLHGFGDDDLFSKEFDFSLTKLVFSFHISKKPLETITKYAMSQCPKLEYLEVSGGPITISTFDLNMVNLKQLKVLNLKELDCNVERLLEFMTKLPSLMKASISSHAIDDQIKQRFPLLFLKYNV